MKNILRIGEFSKINNIPIRTLRFYDQIGLLEPYSIDPDSKYRYYHINQSSLVDAIQYLRQLDFSLEDIKIILSDKHHPHLHQLIEERYQELLQEKKRLEERIKAFNLFRSGAHLYTEHQADKEMEIIHFPERTIWTFDLPDNIYQMDKEEYERHLRYLKQEIFSHHPFYEHFGKVGSLMQLKDFKQQQWVSNQFALMHTPIQQTTFLNEVKLASGYYAVTYCDSFEEEIKQLPHFFQTLKKKQLLPRGPYLCEVVHEQPNLSKQQRDMFIRMQIAVEEF